LPVEADFRELKKSYLAKYGSAVTIPGCYFSSFKALKSVQVWGFFYLFSIKIDKAFKADYSSKCRISELAR